MKTDMVRRAIYHGRIAMSNRRL